MTELALFSSTYFLVLFLGLQSLNVNGGHYKAAFFTSFGIGLGNLVMFKLAPNASPTEMAAFLMGGPFGIISSMALHRRLVAWRGRRTPRFSDGGIVPVSTQQALITLGKYTAGYRPGQDGWTPQDQAAMDEAMGVRHG